MSSKSPDLEKGGASNEDVGATAAQVAPNQKAKDAKQDLTEQIQPASQPPFVEEYEFACDKIHIKMLTL